VPSYLVETYLARGEAGSRTDQERRVRSATAAFTGEIRRVSFERSIYIPDEEICFYVLDAPSASHAAEAANRAGLTAIRITEVVASEKEDT
jgi:hypothetical protein